MATIARDERIRSYAGFIWSVADLLRGDYKQHEYGDVILPFVVLRRLDCVLERTKGAVLTKDRELEGRLANKEPLLRRAAGEQFYNTSQLTLPRTLDDAPNLAANLRAYVRAFSPAAKDVLEKFELDARIRRLDQADLLYLVVSRFCEIDLHPDVVSNLEMGYVYEELIRRFSELSNETAGEHFTPREVIRLMVNLLFIDDAPLLTRPGVVKTLYDPACGTGGMLSVAEAHLRDLHAGASLRVFGQELNAETYAVCRSDMLLKGQDADNIALGNSFSDDAFAGERFDYMLANPPFGVEWKKVERAVRDEHRTRGFGGRFGAGLPRINDGSFLFLQHMIAKMRPPGEGGSRIAIVFNGSPLFTGAAGSGESEIRRFVIEHDWLEAVVALPDQLFYNTGISTYFWVVTNRKPPARRGRVQLLDARELWVRMRRSLGEKRKEISPDQIDEVTRLYGAFEEGERVRILPNEAFGHMRITVERPLRLRWEISEGTLAALRSAPRLAKLGEERREALAEALAFHAGLASTDRAEVAAAVDPLLRAAGLSAAQQRAVWDALAVRDPDAPVVTDHHGDPEPDPELRDQESVPLPAPSAPAPAGYEADPSARLASAECRAAVDAHTEREVLPWVPDAWVDHEHPRGLRDPAHPALLPLRAAPAAGGDRRRDHRPGGGDPGAVGRGDGMTGWRKAPIRRVFEVVNGGTPAADPENWDGEVPWATPVDLGVHHGGAISETERSLSLTGLRTGSRLVPAGSLLVSTRAPIGYIAEAIAPMAFNQGCRGLVPTVSMRVGYFRYQLEHLADELNARGQGSTFVELSGDGLASVPVYVPPRNEQGLIADFLDAETARIDALVAAKRRMIDLLAEREASVIDQAMRSAATRHGLKSLKRATREITVGIVVRPADWYTTTGVPALRGLNVRRGFFDLAELVNISEEGHRVHADSRLSQGDVVVVRSGRAGATAVVGADMDGFNCIDLLIVRPGDAVSSSFLDLALNSEWCRQEMTRLGVGAIQSHLNVEALRRVEVPDVPPSEQMRIVTALRSVRDETHRVKRLLLRQLDLLAERRQALITAAVTGQLDVARTAA